MLFYNHLYAQQPRYQLDYESTLVDGYVDTINQAIYNTAREAICTPTKTYIQARTILVSKLVQFRDNKRF